MFKFYCVTNLKKAEEFILELPTISPRRICFATTHKNALEYNPGAKWVGRFRVPFKETIKTIFETMTGLELFHSEKYGNYWRSIKTKEEYNLIKDWMEQVKNIVFIRDNLDLSIALSEHKLNEEERTSIGELEYRAKYHNDKSSISKLIRLLVDTLKLMPFFTDVDYVCAVPPSEGKVHDLPSELAKAVSALIKKPNITNKLIWANQKKSLKDVKLEEKLLALKMADLQVNCNVNAKKVLILDDMYQSGITINYIAMKILEKGADKIYSIALVKSRKDSDNL